MTSRPLSPSATLRAHPEPARRSSRRALEAHEVDIVFTVLDASMAPVRGVTITAEFSTPDEPVRLEGSTDASGQCTLTAPLTLKRTIHEWRLEGRLLRVRTPDGRFTEFRSAPIAAWFFKSENRDQFRRIYLEDGGARLSVCHVVPTVAQVQARVSVERAPNTHGLVLSTRPVQETRAQGRHYSSGSHLQASIDPVSGQVRYEVHSRAVYYSESAFEFSQVRYATSSTETTTALRSIDHQEQTEPFLGTSHLEQVAFEIPAALVHWIAGSHREGSDRQWLFHLLGKSGATRRMSIPFYEFAGLLARVQDGVSSEPSRTH